MIQPDIHGIAVMALTLVALVLFTRERIPLEATSLFILIALTLGFDLFPYSVDGRTLEPSNFFSGFGHEALVTICALMIIGRSLETTGALEPIARIMARRWKTHPSSSLLATLVFTGILSAFMNNTPIVVMLLPVLVSVALRTGRSASTSLMPMGLATLIGGSGTTIGTSTDLLVVAVAADLGMRRFEMFDFALPVAIAGSIGILYLWLVAPRLLPPRPVLLSDASPFVFDAVFHVHEDSFSNGKTLSDVLKRTDNQMKISRIQREDDLIIVKLPTASIRTGDRLYVSDTAGNLKRFEDLIGATLHNVFDIEHPISEEHPLSAEDQQLAEVVVREGSLLHETTLKNSRFAERFHVVVLAIHRAQSAKALARSGLSDILLHTGDVLLLQGAREDIRELKNRAGMLVLDNTIDLPHTRKAPVALGIFFLVVGAAASGLAPISISALAGVGMVLITGCLSWRDAAGALSTAVIMLIVACLALGMALTSTGGTDYLAQLLVHLTAGFSPVFVMSGLMLLMAVLSNVVSHNAAAVIGTPIAIRIAAELGASPEAFVLAVMFGANMGYATPIAYQTNVLILNAGGYTFSDFLRVGVPLVIIMWLAFSVLLPIFFQL
ncbi:MAG: TRAP transporter large permease subunit [Lysobacterales bacterium]|nr:MAG: TRAP transporter large permease subunit [Xanthomonadales bacterium]